MEPGLANLDLDLFLGLLQGESTKSLVVDDQESSEISLLSDWVEGEDTPLFESQS